MTLSRPKVISDKTYSVTGTLSPDATGSYLEYGDYNGKRYQRRLDGSYFIWWDNVSAWKISAILGVVGASHWLRIDPNIEGDYTPQGTATGTATVAET